MMRHSSSFLEQQKLVIQLDLAEYRKGYEKAKRLSQKNWSGEYYVFYYNKLDYVVPIAFQGGIVLISDLEGKIVNDIYNMSPNYHTKELHICIFPLQANSIVLMFIDSQDVRYRPFYKQIRKLSSDEKLALINYIIFSYSEEVYFSKKIPKEVLNNERLVEIARKTSIAISNKPFGNSIDKACESFDLKRYNEIPNLLSKTYAL